MLYFVAGHVCGLNCSCSLLPQIYKILEVAVRALERIIIKESICQKMTITVQFKIIKNIEEMVVFTHKRWLLLDMGLNKT